MMHVSSYNQDTGSESSAMSPLKWLLKVSVICGKCDE